MSDALQVATSERVAVELPIAGLGSRAMAYLVDLALLGSVALVSYFALTFFIADPVNAALALGSTVRAALVGGTFFALWIYWTLLEVLWNGQTPGKRLMRIRVVRADGSPITAFASAIRNLLRLVDFLPACYPVGTVTMLVDKRHRRLGDLLAGTVLVRDEQIDLSRYEQVQSATVAVDVLEIATQWLARFESLEPGPRTQLGRRIAGKLGVADTGTDVELRDAIRARLGAK